LVAAAVSIWKIIRSLIISALNEWWNGPNYPGTGRRHIDYMALHRYAHLITAPVGTFMAFAEDLISI